MPILLAAVIAMPAVALVAPVGSTPGARLVGPAAGARLWTEIYPNAAPSDRDQVQMGYDPALREVVLFGGYDPTVLPLGDTWTYRSGGWTDLTANLSTAPAARWGAGFAYDPAFGGMVLFGGRNLTQYFQDTWLFNATGWHSIVTRSAPSARAHVAFAFDGADHYLWLFGGAYGNVPVGSGSAFSFWRDTWKLTPSHGWVNLTSTVTGAPRAMAGAAAAYDPASRYVVLADGAGRAPTGGWGLPWNVTYTYAGGTYRSVASSWGPGAEYAPTMAWDPAVKRVVMIGENSSTTLDPTWGFGGGAWTNLTPPYSSSPWTRGNVGLGMDTYDHDLVLFGGDTPPPNYSYRNDTWIYR